MTYEEALAKAKEMVGAAQNVVVVTHGNPTKESLGSSLALMLGLISLGKKATVICPDPVTVELSSFVGVDKVVRDFGKKNFVVSFDYVDGSIEKVSYNIEGKKFNLVVEHRPGFEPLTPDKVNYAYQGVSADLIITVDTLNWNQMGDVYTHNKDFIASKPVVNVDFHNENLNYGQLNLVDPGASSTTELVAELMATLGVKLTTDIATNLLNAIYDATKNFSNPNVTSMAFEVASVCLKAGAKRFGVDAPQQPQPKVEPISQPKADRPMDETPVSSPQPITSEPQIFVGNRPVAPEPPIQSGPSVAQPSTPSIPQPVMHPANGSGQGDGSKKPVQPPQDWLKPKIFKSSGSLV